MNSQAEWSALLQAYAKALGQPALKHLHIHLSGIEYGPKGEKNHLELKQADLDLKSLFRALHEHDCAGRILCEKSHHGEGRLEDEESLDEDQRGEIARRPAPAATPSRTTTMPPGVLPAAPPPEYCPWSGAGIERPGRRRPAEARM